MRDYHTKLAADGRIVLPANLRKELGLEAGKEIVIRIEDEEIRIFSADHAIKKAQEMVGKYTKGKGNMTDIFIASRRDEAKNEWRCRRATEHA